MTSYRKVAKSVYYRVKVKNNEKKKTK